MSIFLFFLIPASSIALLFVKDSNPGRRTMLNILLISNSLLFLYPALKAYWNTPKGESIFNENTGGGAAFWMYIYILPITIIAFIILLILKGIFAPRTDEKSKKE